MTSLGQRIIDGLRDAVVGDFARVTIDGETWIRADWRPIGTAPQDGTRILGFDIHDADDMTPKKRRPLPRAEISHDVWLIGPRGLVNIGS